MIWPSKLLLIYVVALSSVALHTSIGTGNLDRLSGWYTPLDVCLLWDHTTNKVTSDIQRCKKAHPYHAKQPDRCIVGNTWPTKAISCSSLNAIQYFQLSVDLNDPLLLPLQKLFGALSQKKCAFLLIGDSLMAQFFNAIMCELTREGLWTTHPTLTKTNMSKSHFVTSNLSNPPVPVKFIQLYHFAKGLHDRTSDPSMVTLKRGVDEFTRSHNCVFIVINFGAHYSDGLPLQSPVDYVEHMSRVLVYLHAVCEVRPSVRVYWRETAAQHFPTPHGCELNVRNCNDNNFPYFLLVLTNTLSVQKTSHLLAFLYSFRNFVFV